MNLNDVIVLLKTAESVKQIDSRRNEIIELIPQCAIMIGYDQKHPNHQYDLWEHCLHTVIEMPNNLNDEMVYLAALLHDVAKPKCRKDIKEGESLGKVFEGHPELSANIVKKQIIPLLEKKGYFIDSNAQERLIYYIAHHDDHLHCTLQDIQESRKDIPEDVFCNLLYLEIADSKAHRRVKLMEQRIEVCREMLHILKS